MNVLSCASDSRKAVNIPERNREIIFSDDCMATFTQNEKTQDNGGSESHCYFKCDANSGEIRYLGFGSGDPKMLPNCVISKTKTTNLVSARKTIYFIHCTGLSTAAVAAIVTTEYELNRAYITKNWTEYARTKLKSIYEVGGWWELWKWASAYREIFDLKDVTVRELMFK